MRGGLGLLLLIGGLTVAPAAGAIPFDATWGLQLEGTPGPVVFWLPGGEAQIGPGGTLALDGAGAIGAVGTYHSAASFWGYVFVFFGTKNHLLAGTLAPGAGPGGGFGGSVPAPIFTGFYTRGGYSSVPLCFGVRKLGQSLGAFSTCGTLVTVTGWTTGNVTVTGLGGPDLKAQGYDARTPGGLGNLLLVTPIRIDSPLLGSRVGGIGTLTLNFVPEPDTLALTAFGALGLAALGRRRGLQRRS